MSFVMSRFIRQATPVVIEPYFKHRVPDWPTDFDWQADPQKLSRAIKAQISRLESRDGESVLRELHQVDNLSDEIGQDVVFGLVARNTALTAAINSAINQHARAFELLLLDRHLFERALAHAAVARGRNGASYSGFSLGPNVSLADDEAIVRELRLLLPSILSPGTGREPAIVVELDRASGVNENGETTETISIVVYLEGPVQSSLVIRAGSLETEHVRPALRSGIILDRHSGALHVVAKGGKSVRERIAQAFACASLGGGDIAPLPLRQFDLSALKHDIAFPVDPADPIQDVWLEEIELHGITGGQPRLLQKRPEARTGAVGDWTQRDSCFGVPYEMIGSPLTKIHRVVIAVRFHPDVGERRAKPILVAITMPNRCNLREHTERERLIVQKYLPLWGLLREIGDATKRAA